MRRHWHLLRSATETGCDISPLTDRATAAEWATLLNSNERCASGTSYCWTDRVSSYSISMRRRIRSQRPQTTPRCVPPSSSFVTRRLVRVSSRIPSRQAGQGTHRMARPLTASIIVNNYNYGRFVGNALKSALRQTYPHTEVFVVDDGSTDESRDVIAGFEHRVVTILKPNGGQASALNLAFPMTRGDVIYLLDSDDMLESEAVERSIGFFEDPAVVKVHWPMRLIDRRGAATGVVRPKRLLTGNLRA